MTQPNDLVSLAPHAGPQWVEEFVVEQRLLGVPGPRIGDALATVETHLRETGEPVATAFGPARDYARSIAETEPRTSGVDGSVIAFAVLGVVAIVVLPRVTTAAVQGNDVNLTAGDLAGLVVLAGLIAIVLRLAGPLLRGLVAGGRRRGVVTALVAFAGLTALQVAVFLLWRTPVVTVPIAAAGAIGAAALAAATWLGWRQQPDLLADPVGRTVGQPSAARWSTAVVFPGITLVMCLLSWVTSALA